MDGTFDMDNNNSIPYGAINWNNEALASTYAQIEQRERQRESQTDSQIAQFQPNPRPVVSNIVYFDNERQELSDSNVVGSSAASIGAPHSTNVLNFRPPVEQRTFSNNLNGFSNNNLNGFSLQPSYTLLTHNNAGAEMLNQDMENAQYLQCRQVSGTDGAFSGQELASGSQSIPQPGATSITELNRGSGFAFSARDKEKHTKRKSVKDVDDDEKAGICPSRKQLITEERMAARMYNLRISNDHNYVTNGLPISYAASRASSLGQMSRTGRQRQLRASRNRQNRSIGDLEVDEEDEENKRPAPTFHFAPGIKAALSKNGSFLPDEIFKHINQPCVAIVPWRPPLHLGERLCVHNKEQTSLEATDSRENGKVEEEVITDAEPVMDVGAFSIDSTAADDDCFSLDDDMDL